MEEYNHNLHNNSKAIALENARNLRKAGTKAEKILWEALRNEQVCKLKFKRQHPFDDYILDFYNHQMKLVIEVDGEVHRNPEVQDYDKFRTAKLNASGLTVLRFTNNEVESNLKEVLKNIKEWFKKNKSSIESAESFTPLSSRTELVPIIREAGGEVNRLDKLFSTKKNNILNIYCTAGFPQLNSTMEVITALQENGADIIELGIPYSDPIADGPVIQQSNMQALENGMSISILFDQLHGLRKSPGLGGIGEAIPIILMGYMNPVLQFGFERFCGTAAAVGIDGIILPDLPIHEFEMEYQQHFKKYGLKFIFLVTPETSSERIQKIDSLCTGFLYAVSTSSTTGNSHKPIEDQGVYFKKLKDMNLNNRVLVGFGIKDNHTFKTACTFTNGAIIGSAYINALKNTMDIYKTTKDFINTVKG